MNLAGRAGGGGADNWKKAVFGWLAFAVGAMVPETWSGTSRWPTRRPPRRGGAGADDARAREFKQPASEAVLIQSRNDTSQPGVLSAVNSVVQTLAQQKVVTTSATRSSTRARAAVSRTATRARPVRHQGEPGQGEGQGQADHGRDRAPSGLPEPTGRGRSVPRARPTCSKELQEGLRDRRAADDPDHAADPARRIGSLVAACLPVLLAFSAVLASLGLYALVTNACSGDYPDDLLRDPSDRDGRRGGLLAVLHPP